MSATLSQTPVPALDAHRMTPLELRTSAWLASLFALRMLGLFLILPVFAVYARDLPGGTNAALVGLAMGIYSLTQAVLQIPFGYASDKLGRKPVMIFGLVLFALGSFMCAYADSLWLIILGRAIQGSGAISAAVTATIADTTRDEVRSKAMAMVGGSIGATFALALVAAPLLAGSIGLKGMFILTGALALGAIAVVLWKVPTAKATAHATPESSKSALAEVLTRDLLRLNAGIFILHALQMALFVAVPLSLVRVLGIATPEHWKVYLPVVVASFVLLAPVMMFAERKSKIRAVFRTSVALLGATLAGFALWLEQPVMLVALLFAFFVVFNVLESLVPSLVSRQAPPARKGLALGIYNTTQTMGLFVGGALGGRLTQSLGAPSMFWACAGASALWLIICWQMQAPAKKAAPIQ
jgi:MFS family permease